VEPVAEKPQPKKEKKEAPKATFNKGDKVMWEGEERTILSTVKMGNDVKYQIDLGKGKTIWTDGRTLESEKAKAEETKEAPKGEQKPIEFGKQLEQKYGVRVDLLGRLDKGDLTLSRIEVPKGQREKGIGTKVMEEIIKYADENGKRIVLSPTKEFGATSVDRLRAFYKGFGFVENKGNNKDFTIKELMYRLPSQKEEVKPVAETKGGAKESLSQRLKGDALLDAEDTLAELSDNGATINPDGTVVVYHRTSKEKADAIVKNNEMFGLEDGVFFSTSEKGQAEGYGDVVVKMNVPIEQIQIDDTFGNEAHVRIPTKKANQKISVAKFSPQLTKTEGTKPAPKAPETKGAEGDFTAKGGNKVVNEKGEPLVLYHGTDKKFEKFSDEGLGYFFTTDKETAEGYMKKYGSKDGYLKSVNVKISEPIIIDAKGKKWDDIEVETNQMTPQKVKLTTSQILQTVRGLRSPDIFTNLSFTNKKADGLIIKNVIDPLGGIGKPIDLYIPFETKQISELKSLAPTTQTEFTSKQESSASTEFDGMKKPSKIKMKTFDGKHGKGAFNRMQNITQNFEDIMDGLSEKIKQDCL
jgi:predicted GNAT family acetyltransferase